jgi:small subunit ribosomal protein S4
MRKLRKKYKPPRMAWDTVQIAEEKKILSEYGLRKKRELRRTMEVLRNFRRRARELEAKANELEKKRLLDRLVKFSLLETGRGLDDVLALTVRDLLERRLQTIIFRKGRAPSIKQARQAIVHGKVAIDGRKVNIPSYLVTAAEEGKITVKGKTKKEKTVSTEKPAEKKSAADLGADAKQ